MSIVNEILMKVELEMIETRAVDLARYAGRPEESIPADFDQIYRFVVCNNKVTEGENETETAPKQWAVPDFPVKGNMRHVRYELNKAAATRAKTTEAIRKANEKKRERNMWYLCTTCEGAEKPFEKETYILEHKLLERKGRERRAGKKMCRDYIAN